MTPRFNAFSLNRGVFFRFKKIATSEDAAISPQYLIYLLSPTHTFSVTAASAVMIFKYNSCGLNGLLI